MDKILKQYNKFRFIKQRDTFSCGPIAVVNLYKWAGYSYTGKDIKKISKAVGTVKPNFIKGLTGTWSHTINNHLYHDKKIKYIGYKYGNFIKQKEIDNWLDDDGACLVNVYWEKNGEGHYFLIVGHTNKDYVAVNFSHKGKPVELVSKKEIVKLLKNDRWDAEGWHLGCIFWIKKK